MDPQTPDQAIAALLNTMNKGQYALFAIALDQLGGELRVDWDRFTAIASSPPQAEVDATDGPVLVRLAIEP